MSAHQKPIQRSNCSRKHWAPFPSTLQNHTNVWRIGKFVNESKRTSEDQHTLLELFKQIKGDYPVRILRFANMLFQNLVQPHRKFVVEDVFKVVKKSKHISDDLLHFYLFRDLLVMQTESKSLFGSHNTYFAFLSLTKLKPADGPLQIAFEYLTEGEKATICVQAPSQEVKDNWLAKLTECIGT